MKIGAQLLLLAGVGTLLLSTCVAKGINQGKRPHRLNLYSRDEWYYNHVPANDAVRVPDEFNWCDLGNGTSYCTASWNQHEPRYCGSCWAHGTLSMIQDRLKGRKVQAGDITPDVMLGRQTLLNCAPFKGYSEGCNGGEPLDVFKYMAEDGLPDESCMHYQATDYMVFKKNGHSKCPAIGKCMNCMPTGDDVNDFKCWAVKEPVVYKLTSYGKLDAGEEAMKQEIFARGPIVCGIACPEEFVYKYHSAKNGGIYVDKSGDTELDHDVEVVGWGEENGQKYWLVRNSWGSYWGSLGFFKLERGTNALQIESGDCWYANPEYSVETQVVNGELEGSMYGLEDHGKHHKPHHRHDDDDDDDHHEGHHHHQDDDDDDENEHDEVHHMHHDDDHKSDDDDDHDDEASEYNEGRDSAWVGVTSAMLKMGNTCAHMKQAAGAAVSKVWGIVSGAGSSWLQQQQPQAQQPAQSSGRWGMKRVFGGPQVAMQ